MEKTRIVQEYCKLRQMVVSVNEEVLEEQGKEKLGKYIECLNREAVCSELDCKFACSPERSEEINDPF